MTTQLKWELRRHSSSSIAVARAAAQVAMDCPGDVMTRARQQQKAEKQMDIFKPYHGTGKLEEETPMPKQKPEPAQEKKQHRTEEEKLEAMEAIRQEWAKAVPGWFTSKGTRCKRHRKMPEGKKWPKKKRSRSQEAEMKKKQRRDWSDEKWKKHNDLSKALKRTRATQQKAKKKVQKQADKDHKKAEANRKKLDKKAEKKKQKAEEWKRMSVPCRVNRAILGYKRSW